MEAVSRFVDPATVGLPRKPTEIITALFLSQQVESQKQGYGSFSTATASPAVAVALSAASTTAGAAAGKDEETAPLSLVHFLLSVWNPSVVCRADALPCLCVGVMCLWPCPVILLSYLVCLCLTAEVSHVPL